MRTKILALLLIVATAFAITSCSAKPELDFDDAKKNLKGNDYTVTVVDDEDELDIGVVERLSARSEDGDDYVYIIRYEKTKMAKLAYEAMKLQYDAEIESIELEIKQIEYILDKYDRDLTSDEIDEYEDKIKELEDELEEMTEENAFGIKGKVVWMGTVGAIEDSKK